MKRIRVLVVEDSLTVRKRIVEVLSADPGIKVIAEAEDGREAIELCRTLRPDVITLDMMLPVMTGVAATEYIMAHFPTPILIVSSSTNRGEMFRTYDALAAGAVEVLDKPTGKEEDGEWEKRLVATTRVVSRIKVITHIRARLPKPRPLAPGRPAGARGRSEAECGLIAIGASTGGPAALLEILRALPPSLSVPLLLVLHIGEKFAPAFADWLDGQTSHRVAYARDGEPLADTIGRIVMAPAERHLLVEEGCLRLSDGPPRHHCKPSVDVLFESVAKGCGATALGCLLTGMGRDGAAGLLEIRRAGGLTIAQDEATSVIYGMPREAVRLGAAERVLPLREIAATIAAAVGGTRA